MTEISNGNQIKIAVLSNVNLNFVIRKLRRVFCVFETEGYGNELGTMMDRESAYSRFQPEFTFLLMELSELVRSASSAARRTRGSHGSRRSLLSGRRVFPKCGK